MAPDPRQRAARIRLAVFDVDGVLTDGGLVLSDSGEELKIFHVRDGQGIVMLRDSGVQVAVITGRSSTVVAERMAALGVKYVFQGRNDKLPAFEQLLRELALDPQQAAYMGDDLPDLPPMGRAGLAAAPADAHPQVLDRAHWRARLGGGRGAVRELCELIMEAQGTLAGRMASYLA